MINLNNHEAGGNRMFVGGLPAEFFDPNYKGPWELRGKSGQLITCEREEEKIKIFANDRSAFFIAQMRGTCLELSLRSRLLAPLDSNQKHKDFYAREFVSEAIRYFETIGKPIESFEANWPNSNEVFVDNYTKFLQAIMEQGLTLKEIENKIDQIKHWRKIVKAINRTWTGKLMKELHFSPRGITVNNMVAGGVLVAFEKHKREFVKDFIRMIQQVIRG